MSYQYSVTERRKRTTSGGYGHSGNRSAFGYWVPLTLTVTAAAIGVAAWIWSERRDDEVDSSEDEHYPGGVPPPGYQSMSGALPAQGQPPPGAFQGPGPGPQQPGDSVVPEARRLVGIKVLPLGTSMEAGNIDPPDPRQ